MAQCSSLQNPPNGNVSLSNSVALYSCLDGYRLDGQETRYCSNNTAQWLGQAPTCTREYFFFSTDEYISLWICTANYNIHSYIPIVVVNCGNPPRVAHGYYTLSRQTIFNSVASYHCDSQYILDGTRTRRCQLNDQWSGHAPICKRMFPIIS